MIINQKVYDGSLIHKRFAYEHFRKNVLPVGNIVAFRAPMDVTTNLIDLEDTLNNDYIHSEDAINFCWEIPLLDNPFGAVAFQRLFCTQVGVELHKILKVPVVVDGDDIMVYKEHHQGGVKQDHGKASVSITYVKDKAALGHLGININAGKKAPAFAFSTEMDEDTINDFMGRVINIFYSMVDDHFIATTKICNVS